MELISGGVEVGEEVHSAGVNKRITEHTAQTIHQRLTATIAGQRPDYTGERTERIRTIFVLRAVRHLSRYHRPAQRSLNGCWSALCLDHPETAAGCHGHRASQARSEASRCHDQASGGLEMIAHRDRLNRSVSAT